MKRIIFYWSDGHWCFKQGLQFDRNNSLPHKTMTVPASGEIADWQIYELVSNILKETNEQYASNCQDELL